MTLDVDGTGITKVEDRVLMLIRIMDHARGDYSQLCNFSGEVRGSFLQMTSSTLKDMVHT